VKLQLSSYTRSKYTQAVPKFKNLELHDSSFTRSKFTERGGLKFNNSAPGPNHAPFGGILSCTRMDLPLDCIRQWDKKLFWITVALNLLTFYVQFHILLYQRVYVSMPRCEGLPSGPCPAGVNDATVRSTQGDLFLCRSCEEERFPYITVVNKNKRNNANNKKPASQIGPALSGSMASIGSASGPGIEDTPSVSLQPESSMTRSAPQPVKSPGASDHCLPMLLSTSQW